MHDHPDPRHRARDDQGQHRLPVDGQAGRAASWPSPSACPRCRPTQRRCRTTSSSWTRPTAATPRSQLTVLKRVGPKNQLDLAGGRVEPSGRRAALPGPGRAVPADHEPPGGSGRDDRADHADLGARSSRSTCPRATSPTGRAAAATATTRRPRPRRRSRSGRAPSTPVTTRARGSSTAPPRSPTRCRTRPRRPPRRPRRRLARPLARGELRRRRSGGAGAQGAPVLRGRRRRSLGEARAAAPRARPGAGARVAADRWRRSARRRRRSVRRRRSSREPLVPLEPVPPPLDVAPDDPLTCPRSSPAEEGVPDEDAPLDDEDDVVVVVVVVLELVDAAGCEATVAVGTVSGGAPAVSVAGEVPPHAARPAPAARAAAIAARRPGRAIRAATRRRGTSRASDRRAAPCAVRSEGSRSDPSGRAGRTSCRSAGSRPPRAAPTGSAPAGRSWATTSSGSPVSRST